LRGLLQKRSTRWSERAFVAEGAELVRSALESGLAVESLYVSPEGSSDEATRRVCDRAVAGGVRVFPLAPGVLERVADTVTPQPVMAVLPMLDDPAQECWTARPASLVVVLVDVRDPGNAGTVLRGADASGVDAVVFAAESVDPYNPKTVRSSAGSLFHVPFAVWDTPAASAAVRLAGGGYRTLGTVVRGGEDYAAVDWSRPTALFLGNESSGLDADLCESLSGTVAVPMVGRAESLNVGVAAAVMCFEALRQRRVAEAVPSPAGRSFGPARDGI
jgi:TrmH family RNA methyltransferase